MAKNVTNGTRDRGDPNVPLAQGSGEAEWCRMEPWQGSTHPFAPPAHPWAAGRAGPRCSWPVMLSALLLDPKSSCRAVPKYLSAAQGFSLISAR